MWCIKVHAHLQAQNERNLNRIEGGRRAVIISAFRTISLFIVFRLYVDVSLMFTSKQFNQCVFMDFVAYVSMVR